MKRKKKTPLFSDVCFLSFPDFLEKKLQECETQSFRSRKNGKHLVLGKQPGPRALILQSRVDTGKWESLSGSDPLPEKYLCSSWVWVLEEMDEKTTRVIVRVRSDTNPG
ncbi:MAG: hypothetical protein OQK59_03035, partial [Chlorobium sp.]|nr:hypothetical protein [Chlorobium sp.]